MAIVELGCTVAAESKQEPAQQPLPIGLDKEARLRALIEKVKAREHRK